jgi:hypothetical protein
LGTEADLVRTFGRVLLGLALSAVVLWWSLALYFRLALPAPWPTVAAALWGVGALGVLVWLRPFRWGALLVLAGCALLGLWWGTIRPSNDRDWAPEYANPPWGELDGDRLTLHNVRNFDYRTETDFTERWETRTFDLSRITGLDIFLSYWGSPRIAHSFLSWEFADGPPLAISIETRRERTETYSAIRGFFRQFEIFYVAADERDLARLRTNYRGENVFLYRLRTPPERARAILMDYLKSMNALRDRPAWYNAFTDNCTTGIRTHTKAVGGFAALDWRLLATGYLDRMLYERGGVDTRLPFEQLKAAGQVDARAKAADQDPAFSARIREGVPRP